jgi:hypothetical protein
LNAIPLKEAENPFPSPTRSKKTFRPPVTATPVPGGYDNQAYNKSQKIAEEGRNPTPEELTSLLRLMEFDSPAGEMKYEAREIWREMRSRKIFPTEQGYVALLKVLPPMTWVDNRLRRDRGIR